MAKRTQGAAPAGGRGKPRWPRRIADEAQLEEMLSRPGREVVDLFARLKGDLAILGGAGKIGPSLAGMACRARALAGTAQKIMVVDRFPDAPGREALERLGARTIACDLLDPAAVDALPEAANVIYMVGTKFGTTGRPSLTWAINGLVPAYAARRYRDARIVAFSTGCVYGMTPAGSAGSVETDPLEPVGEYSNSCVARERLLEHCALTNGTKMVLVRLNYAVEMRYGVLVDLANSILAGRPVDLTMGYANVIWQGAVNSSVLRLLEHAACPPLALNLTGLEKVSVRQASLRLGRLMGRKVLFAGREARTALLSDAAKAAALLGAPKVPVDRILQWTADWMTSGGRTLGKPTHFQSRDGRY